MKNQTLTHNLTEMERTILTEIPLDNFYEQGFESALWTRFFLSDTCSIEGRKARGVLSSLSKKGYLCIIDNSEEDNPWMKSYFTLEAPAIDFLKTESGLHFNSWGGLVEEEDLKAQLEEEKAAAERRVDELLAGLSFEERMILSAKFKGGEE